MRVTSHGHEPKNRSKLRVDVKKGRCDDEKVDPAGGNACAARVEAGVASARERREEPRQVRLASRLLHVDRRREWYENEK